MTKSSTKNTPSEVRVALIGYGTAGRIFHAPLISSTPGLRLCAVVSGNPDRKASAHKDLGQVRIFDSVEDLWHNASDFDVVVVASPNTTHAPLAMAALQNGLAVVVDKPMAVSATECEELILESKKSGKLLTVFHNRRWDGDFLTVAELLRANKLGAVTRYESRYDRYRPKPKPGSWREQGTADDAAGLLFDLGSHLIDQALVLFGRPTSVYAETNVRRQTVTADDDSFVALTFEGGIRAHLWMSALVLKPAPRFRICGMQGTYQKYGIDPQEDCLRAGLRPDAGWGQEPEDQWGTLWCHEGGLHFRSKVETLAGNYPAFYAQLRDALLQGSAPPVDPRDALLTLKVIEAAHESAREGKVVSLAAPAVLTRPART